MQRGNRIPGYFRETAQVDDYNPEANVSIALSDLQEPKNKPVRI
jgi:hypothetical protein